MFSNLPPLRGWCFFFLLSVLLVWSSVILRLLFLLYQQSYLSLVTPAEAFLTSVTAKLKGADMYNDDRYQYKAGGIIKSSRFKAVFLIWILKF